jgi:hypothetical protein
MNTLNNLIKHWAFLSESEENFTSENIFRKTTANHYMNKQLVNEQINSILLEGGNAIKDAVRINQENVAPTLEEIYTKLLPKIGIKKEDTAVLGSTGKKLPGGSSGDIDLAIDISKISNYDFKTWSANIESTLTDLGIEFRTFPGISLLSVKWPISNKDGKQANEFVQLDLMPTEDIEFSVFSKYSETEQEGIPFYKSLIRNAIMISLMQCLPVKIFAKGKLAIDPDGEDHPVDYEKFSYDFNKGLFLKHKIRKPRKDGTYNKTIVTLEKTLITKNPFFIKFPKNANEALIDYFVLDNKDDLFKVSAKVDAGAKPSITNILRNIDEFLSTDSGKKFIKKLQQNNKLDSAAIDSVKWLIASIRKPTVLKSFANIAECMRKILEGNTENYEWANLLFKKFNLSEEDKQILNISLDVNDPANNSLEFQKVEDIIKLVNKIAGKPIASRIKKR